VPNEAQLRLAVSFIRLLFKNSEEVKRTRFSQAGFVWVVIALLSFGDLSPHCLTKRSLWSFVRPSFTEFAELRVIGSSE
jgi:hypothetical protein